MTNVRTPMNSCHMSFKNDSEINNLKNFQATKQNNINNNNFNTNTNSINNTNSNTNNCNNGGNNNSNNSDKANFSNTNTFSFNNNINESKSINSNNKINGANENIFNISANSNSRNKMSKKSNNNPINNNNKKGNTQINAPKTKTNINNFKTNTHNNFKNKSKNKKVGNDYNTSTTLNNKKDNKNNFQTNKSVTINKMPDIDINKGEFYQTVDNHNNNIDFDFKSNLNDLLNNTPNNLHNNRNENIKESLNTLKSLNSIKSYQQNPGTITQNNKSNNVNNSNLNSFNCSKNLNTNKINNTAYQTYSGPFRCNDNNILIKVNMIDSSQNIENINNIDSYNGVIYSNKKPTNTKSNIINSSIKKSDNKNLFIENEIQNKNSQSNNSTLKKNQNNPNTVYTKSSINNNGIKTNKTKTNNKIISKKNAETINNKNNKKNSNSLNGEIDGDFTDHEKKTKDDKNIQKSNNLSPKSQLSSGNYSNEIHKNNMIKSCETIAEMKTADPLNIKTFPLSRDGSKAYIKKKSTNINSYEKSNSISNKNTYKITTNRSNLSNKISKNSFSPVCYNSQRIFKNDLINYNEDNDNIYVIKNNKVSDIKTVTIPEYKYKMDKIRTRVINLLEVYSLLALKSINIPGSNNGNQYGNGREENEK